MNITKLQSSPSGRLTKNPQGDWTFVPNPLPPKLEYTAELAILLSEADRALGALEGMGRTLPNANLLVVPYMRREAVLSSRIEGTQASLSDLFLFEAAKGEVSETSDVREVSNYVTAMHYGLKRLRELPLSLRLVRELHEKLLQGARGQEQRPGEFRKRQNWVGTHGTAIGKAVYVPPAVAEMERVLDDWEKFLHSQQLMPPLVQCALMHCQFESIHPFLDGNGRVGRLLITLFLCERKYLSQPLLYLSGYLESHRREYYEQLQAVREDGDWTGWIHYFLQAVAYQASDALACAHRILQLKETYRAKLQERKRVTVPVMALLDSLFLNPYVTSTDATKRMKVTLPTAIAALEKLERLGIVRETTGRKTYRVYLAEELLRVIESAPAKET